MRASPAYLGLLLRASLCGLRPQSSGSRASRARRGARYAGFARIPRAPLVCLTPRASPASLALVPLPLRSHCASGTASHTDRLHFNNSSLSRPFSYTSQHSPSPLSLLSSFLNSRSLALHTHPRSPFQSFLPSILPIIPAPSPSRSATPLHLRSCSTVCILSPFLHCFCFTLLCYHSLLFFHPALPYCVSYLRFPHICLSTLMTCVTCCCTLRLLTPSHYARYLHCCQQPSSHYLMLLREYVGALVSHLCVVVGIWKSLKST